MRTMEVVTKEMYDLQDSIEDSTTLSEEYKKGFLEGMNKGYAYAMEINAIAFEDANR